MGMHNATDRMRKVIKGLSRFYHLKYQQLQGDEGRYSGDFNPDAEYWEDEGSVDQPYLSYINDLSEGIDELLAEMGVTLDPVPPGLASEVKHETLMAGAHMLKWDIEVHDADSGQFIGRLEWALYHRHDRFSVPGPAQISYIKSRGGRTMMVG